MFGNRNCGTNMSAHARKKDTSVLFEIHLIPFIYVGVTLFSMW